MEEFKKLIEKGESKNLEFKSSLSTKEEIGGKLGERLGERLGENQKKILILINQNKFITIPELSGNLKISTTAIEKNLAKLKQKGLLKRIGPAKGGYWEVVEK